MNYENDPIVKRELRELSEASLHAYGARICVKTILPKSRITPLKEITITTLELLGKLILARLMNSVKINIERNVQIDNIYCWEDSKVCLSWINSEKSFNIFVDNRVKEIKRLSNKISRFFCENKKNPSELFTEMG